ncbi:MAG TPA: hypothetical protein VFU35_13780 [Jatrophihabitans sp.]|nr:hypothetical protein [Jatrophihabitans sp.]
MNTIDIIGFMTAHRALSTEAASALPDAPVVLPAERHAGRARVALAAGLRRFADALAPARPVGSGASRLAMSTGSETH